MLTGAWINLIGYPPFGFEWLPYVMSSLFIFLIVVFIIEFLIYYYFKIIGK